VHGQGLKVLILSERPETLMPEDRIPPERGLEVRLVSSEYECAREIENFRPDYVIVDCALGRKRTGEVCNAIFDDPRIPVPRIILTSKTRSIRDYCDREVFGWIRKPFPPERLRECLEGAEKAVA
jgi:CheY-like chemotaxis protein